jgi:ABC-2 type transport system ATP-binding protein
MTISTNPVIEAQGLSKYYHKNQVLKNINVSIQPGEIIGYIGPNGAGKSTTIKIMAGIIPDFEGRVSVLGYDIREQALEAKKRIGYIPENASLYETLTPLEYLTFVGQLHSLPAKWVAQKATELLNLFELYNKRDSRMTSFSKGMRQKVLLIAGLLHNPDLIFLDEPLSGLDANAVILTKEILLQLRQSGKTIFYSSHIMDVVEKISNRIIIIQAGQIIAQGTFDELKTSQQGSLEQIFTQLTGNHEHHSIAEQFVKTMAES